MTEMINTQSHMLHLQVPAKAEYLSLIRLVIAAVAKDRGFSDESIADLKVAISEASSNVIRHAYGNDASRDECIIEISCCMKNDCLELQVIDHGCGMTVPPPPSGGLGFGIIGSLMDKVDVETGRGGTTVVMEKDPLAPRD